MGLRNRKGFWLRICILAIYLCVWTGCSAKTSVAEEEEYLDPVSLIPLDLEYLANWGVSEAIRKVPDTYYAWAIVHTQSGETEYDPHFTLELSDDGTGWCETEEEYFELVWHKGEDLTVTLEGNEQIYCFSMYMNPVLGFDGLFFSMKMNEKVVWLYNLTN